MFQIEITDDADFFYVNVITNVYCMLNSMSVLMLINMICYFMCSFFKVSALFLSHYFESMNKSRERCSSLKLKSCHNFKFRPSKNFYSKAENFCFQKCFEKFFFHNNGRHGSTTRSQLILKVQFCSSLSSSPSLSSEQTWPTLQQHFAM